MADDPGAERSRRGELRRAFVLGLIANFSLHVLTGFAAVGVHYGILYILLQLGVEPLIASDIGFCGGAATRFALAYWRVFAPTQGLTIAGRRFLVALGAQALANTALLGLLLSMGIGVWPAQIATTILLTFGNYAAYRLWVFR
ncbi:MAG TPA: GtrA family protein [Casimicrobiaceae bacterium]|nr:GtrA family protein [Casimicrobiaceae bacterium]